LQRSYELLWASPEHEDAFMKCNISTPAIRVLNDWEVQL
jgi:hypothetical protein